MFENVLPTNLNIYVTTASNAVESSWGCYCSPDDVVDGTPVGSCLGDLYSVNWMEDADKQSPLGMKETLQQQFVTVRTLTTMSHVMQYGDLTFTNWTIGQFQGEVSQSTIGRAAPDTPKPAPSSAGIVGSRDIKMHSLYYSYLRHDKSDIFGAHAAAEALQAEISHRLQADSMFMKLTESAVQGENWGSIFTMPTPTPILPSSCVDAVYDAVAQYCGGFSDYSIQYTRVVNNLCVFHRHNHDATAQLVNTVRSLCV